MKRTLYQFAWLLVGAGAIVIFLYYPLRDARRAAIANAVQSSFNQLQLAMLNYHSEHGEFPPAYIADEHGKPIHSWRVLILPYIEQSDLYSKYDFDEPWNGPNNIQLADQMPGIFHVEGEQESNRNTNVVAVTGADTAFPGNASTTLADFVDGPENTILLAEISNSSVCWLDPQDLEAEGMTRNDNANAALRLSSVP